MVGRGGVTLRLEAEYGHADVTAELQAGVEASGVRDGIAVVQVVGSTGAVTTIEYESGAVADLGRTLERLAPAGGEYEHNARWGDGNGFSHVRSALLKTGVAVSITDGRLQLGTWQQIVAFNFDNRDRERQVVWTIVGE